MKTKNECKNRKLTISGRNWHNDPPAEIIIQRKHSMGPLLLWVALLEEFCRRLKARHCHAN